MDDVVIYGAGGLGAVVLDILEHAGQFRPVAFLDSDHRMHGTTVLGLPVAGDLAALNDLHRRGVRNAIVAVGDNAARVALADVLARSGVRLVSAIHPLASFALSARVAEHVIIGARVSVCVHATIGPHSVLSPGAIIEHDNRIGRGVFLEPAVRLAGGVCVEEFATIGVGACVIPGCTVGTWAHVRPGAVVIRDVPPHATAAGVPAGVRDSTRFVPDPRPGRAAPPSLGQASRLPVASPPCGRR